MAYDFAGSWTAQTGHQSQLYPGRSDESSGSGAVDYILSTGFPASKLLLGIPVYGRSFLGAGGPGQTYTGHGGEDGVFEYKQLPRPDTDEVIDTRVVAASCSGGDGGFVSYDNPETVKVKAQYCRDKGLGVSRQAQSRKWYALTDLGYTGLVLLDWHCRRTTWPEKSNCCWLQSVT